MFFKIFLILSFCVFGAERDELAFFHGDVQTFAKHTLVRLGALQAPGKRQKVTEDEKQQLGEDYTRLMSFRAPWFSNEQTRVFLKETFEEYAEFEKMDDWHFWHTKIFIDGFLNVTEVSERLEDRGEGEFDCSLLSGEERARALALGFAMDRPGQNHIPGVLLQGQHVNEPMCSALKAMGAGKKLSSKSEGRAREIYLAAKIYHDVMAKPMNAERAVVLAKKYNPIFGVLPLDMDRVKREFFKANGVVPENLDAAILGDYEVVVKVGQEEQKKPVTLKSMVFDMAINSDKPQALQKCAVSIWLPFAWAGSGHIVDIPCFDVSSFFCFVSEGLERSDTETLYKANMKESVAKVFGWKNKQPMYIFFKMNKIYGMGSVFLCDREKFPQEYTFPLKMKAVISGWCGVNAYRKDSACGPSLVRLEFEEVSSLGKGIFKDAKTGLEMFFVNHEDLARSLRKSKES